MTTTILKLQLLTPRQIIDLAKQIVKQCHDNSDIAKRLGDSDDLFQAVCNLLIEFKLGARDLRPGHSLEEAVCSLARGPSRRNWMSDRATECDIEEVADDHTEHTDADAVEVDDEEAGHGHSLDDIPGLSALDKLLIQHDAHRSAQTSDVATFFGITTRAVRMRKEKLHDQLIARFNLPPAVFKEEAEPKLPHLTKKVKEEKDPLANFIPLKPTNFNGFRTVGIR